MSVKRFQRAIPVMLALRKALVPLLAFGSLAACASAPAAQAVANTDWSVTTAKPGQLKDGVYIGPSVSAYYGLVQVQATVQSGRLANVQFLQYPSDRRTSQQINSIVMPYLTQEALKAQSAYVNVISGATLTSEAFAQSLNAALKQASNAL